jgi:hypothetical protein
LLALFSPKRVEACSPKVDFRFSAFFEFAAGTDRIAGGASA